MTALALWAGLAWAPWDAAAYPLDEVRRAELDRVRAQIADQVQLAAYDLVDELVYGWTVEPVFETPTPVVLAGVTVPVGLGTGLQALLENHVANVLLHNPSARVELVHCPSCTAVLVRSGPEATVVSRGIDDPEVLAELGAATGKHALFLDVEAEGSWLVLRARLTRLTPDLPIVWSHTLATSAGTPALLRLPDDLKSAQQAHAEYLDALRDRGPLTVPLRFVLRTYAVPDDDTGVAAPPFLWVQTGVELAPTEGRAWTSSLLAGFSFIPQAYQGLMAQARVSRLVSGRFRSHTSPDLYVFGGGAVMTVWGLATGPFHDDKLTADDIINAINEDGPRSAFGALHLGLEVRMGNRIGVSTFLENMPSLGDSPNFGDYVRVASIGFQSFGTEVTFCF